MESGNPEESATTMDRIESFLNQYDEGVFIVRCILPENNDKGEAYGHSTLFIKTENHHYFYDPDEGIFKLSKGCESEALHQLVKRMMLKSAVPFGRIYKIQESSHSDLH